MSVTIQDTDGIVTSPIDPLGTDNRSEWPMTKAQTHEFVLDLLGRSVKAAGYVEPSTLDSRGRLIPNLSSGSTATPEDRAEDGLSILQGIESTRSYIKAIIVRTKFTTTGPLDSRHPLAIELDVLDYYTYLVKQRMGVDLNSTDSLAKPMLPDYLPLADSWDTRCFPAHTRIQTSLITSVAISTLSPGDIVLSYDARANIGRGRLVPRRVVRI